MKKENKLENSLIIPEKENLFTRFFKWVKNIFGKKEEKICSEEAPTYEFPSITIPKAVKMPIQIEETEVFAENSLEYLYKMSDDELDQLDKIYDEQMEEARSEIEKLEDILQTYKQSIKNLQNQIPDTDSIN